MTPPDAESERDALLIQLAKVKVRRDVAIKERDEARAERETMMCQRNEAIERLVQNSATARKQAFAEAEDYVRRHGEEELADAIEALAPARGEPNIDSLKAWNQESRRNVTTRRVALAEVQEKLTDLWKLESGRWEAAIQAAMNAVAELADGIAPASADPRDAELGMLRQALSKCGQRRLSTEANNRRLREALEWLGAAVVNGEIVHTIKREEAVHRIRAALTQSAAKGEGEVKA